MRICITGITGFVGSTAANYFGQAGYDIIGIGRQGTLPPHIAVPCEYLQCDIQKPLPPIKADIVIHAAALASDTAAYKNLYNSNVTGTAHVLKATAGAAAFIHISSSSVYNFNNRIATEREGGQSLPALSAYGQTKFLAEALVAENKTFVHKYILRPRAIYGVHDRVLLPRLLKLVKGNKIILPRHLAQAISLTHINNLMAAIALCIQQPAANPVIYNVADAEIYNLKHILLSLLASVTGNDLRVVTIPEWMWELLITLSEKTKLHASLNKFASASLTRNAVLSIEAIKSAGYKPVHDFYNSYEAIGQWVRSTGGWQSHVKK